MNRSMDDTVRKRVAQVRTAEAVPADRIERPTRACFVAYFTSVTLLLILCVMVVLR